MGYWTAIISFLVALAITPYIGKLAIKIGAVDKPNERKVHKSAMPSMGGLAIFISFLVGLAFTYPNSPETLYILAGGLVIILTGLVDDIKEISPKWKLLGQLLAAGIVIYGGVIAEFINLPFGGQLHFGYLSIPITVLWIVGITNAINLLDGLDGLAAGVSSIVLLTISGMAIVMGDTVVATLGFLVFASTIGFLFYNFNPAKIFMGDTGALFLGYMIAVLSLLGFKNLTLFSLIVPIIILGVPISDTFFAIVRRIVQKKPFSAPDKSHLHHCLLNLGYSHKQTVLLIYAMSILFSVAAIIFSQATLWGALAVLGILTILIELMVELTGVVSKNYRPILNKVMTIKVKQEK